MKKRKFRKETINAIGDACIQNSPNLWKIIDQVCPQPLSLNGATGQEFIDYFIELPVPQHLDYIDSSLENEAKSFWNRHGPVIDNTYHGVSYLEWRWGWAVGGGGGVVCVCVLGVGGWWWVGWVLIIWWLYLMIWWLYPFIVRPWSKTCYNCLKV